MRRTNRAIFLVLSTLTLLGLASCGEDSKFPGWDTTDGDAADGDVVVPFDDDDDNDDADGDDSVPSRYAPLVQAVRAEMAPGDARSWDIPGVAFGLLEDGELTFSHALGSKSPDRDDPMLSDTLFRIASVSKMMTAAGLMREVDAGTVTLNQLVTEFAPGFATADGRTEASQLTLMHCLTMSTGLYDLIYIGWPGTCPQSLESFFDGGEYVQNSLSVFLAPPGVMYNYSNPNYMLAGLALEKASGVPFGQYLENHIFTPLDMTRTFFAPSKAQADGNVANGRCSLDYCMYLYPSDPTEAPSDWYTEVTSGSYDCGWGWPSAFGFSNIQDLARFASFLMQGNTDVLLDASRLAMQTPQINTEMAGDMLHYGYGLLVQQGIYIGNSFYDIKIVMHDGAMPGYSSSVYTVPELGFGFIALSNTDYAQIFNAFVTALSLYAPLPQPTIGPDNSNDPADYPRYAGTYEDTVSGYKLTIQNGETVLTASGEWVQSVFGISQVTLDGSFYAKHNFLMGSLPITFIFDEQGNATFIRNRFVVFQRQSETVRKTGKARFIPQPFTSQQWAQARQDDYQQRLWSRRVLPGQVH